MTVGTQAAVLASLDITMFIEFQPAHDSEWGELHHVPRVLKFFYYIAITSAFCANILVVCQTTLLSLLGSSLALRGPDGSMITATDGLYEERKTVFAAFAFGLAATMGSVLILVWLMLTPEAAVVCMSVTILTAIKMYSDYYRVQKRFEYDETETVSFDDIFEGPAAIMAIPNLFRGNMKSRGRDKYKYHEKIRSDEYNYVQGGRVKRSESSPHFHFDDDEFHFDDANAKESMNHSEHARYRDRDHSISPSRRKKNQLTII